MVILNRESIINLIGNESALLTGLVDPAIQLQPNGVDLSLKEVAYIESAGKIDFDNKKRIISTNRPIHFKNNYVKLQPGMYLITFNEIINLPKDVIALGFPRSSILRCGASIHTAVWDAGYRGRSQSLLVIHNPHGISFRKNARVIQLIFLKLDSLTNRGYSGVFQNENINVNKTRTKNREGSHLPVPSQNRTHP